MTIFSILLISLGLAMDAFAVSLSTGMTANRLKPKHAIKMGLFCGIFQMLMPILGWLLGTTVSKYIEAVDHWIAFGLLALIGGRMIYEALKKDKPEKPSDQELFSFKRLTLLAIATSIDALAVGVSFALLDVNIWLASGIIGAVAFTLSLAGCLLGKKLGPIIKNKAELLGGAILVVIGLRILIEHLF